MIKSLIPLIIVVAMSISISSRAQVPSGRVKDTTLVKIIDMVLDSALQYESETKFYVISVSIKNMEVKDLMKDLMHKTYGRVREIRRRTSYEVELSLDRSLSYFEFNTPCFSFIRGNRMILFFTGLENIIEISEKEKKRLVKSIKNFLPEQSAIFMTPSWVYKVDGGEITFVKSSGHKVR